MVLKVTQPIFPKIVKQLSLIRLDVLHHRGILGVILDLDNTIVSEDDRYLSPHFETWIARAKAQGIKFFILSNGKRRYRVEYWSHRLDIPALSPARKPLFGFRKALKHLQLKPEQAIAIGDSRHTDVLGAWLVGCPCIQVASLPHPPRWWEHLLGRWVQVPYPDKHELWSFDASLENL
ncbi:MAG: YqeG family HAD IIIA-type phosphatase [Cyanobacteria bacterium SID2]|nr:YqeG family HAD IIIA-type phosphatase [Cyanobacteria bacterium SID2]MBP0005903.1 YqeG family HAD IIIA-type phosphatase [Cyanobacteria bacterium SBC]